MLLIFSSFDNRLSNLTSMISDESKKEDDRFEVAKKVIFRWESNHDSMMRGSAVPWEDSPDESAEYLLAVNEILSLMEGLSVGSDHEISDQAENAIQIAMSRLEDEFRHILTRNTVLLDYDRLYGSIRRVSLSFASHDGDFTKEFDSFGEMDDDRFHERGGSFGDDVCVDLINPDTVMELKEIAYRMIRSGYEKECVQVYSSVRRDALDECLMVLGVEKLSIEEVQKIEWKLLDEKMKKWIHVVKSGVRVLLVGERRLSDLIFEVGALKQSSSSGFVLFFFDCKRP